MTVQAKVPTEIELVNLFSRFVKRCDTVEELNQLGVRMKNDLERFDTFTGVKMACATQWRIGKVVMESQNEGEE